MYLQNGKIRKRALRVVFDDYESSYIESLKKANRTLLYVSRMKTIGVEMYKCRHQLNPTFVSNMFSVPERMYNLRRGSQFVQHNANTTTLGLNTLRCEGARIWNMIPEHIKAANDVHHFKSVMNPLVRPRVSLWELYLGLYLQTFDGRRASACYLLAICIHRFYTLPIWFSHVLCYIVYLYIITIVHLYIFIILILSFSRLIAAMAHIVCFYPERL